MTQDANAIAAKAVAHLTGSRREMVGDYPKSAEAPETPPERVWVSRPIAPDHRAFLRDNDPLVQAARAMRDRMEGEGA
mgnify:CR=1 FL=1